MQVKKEIMERAIRTSAIEAFAREGYSGASLRRIAQEAGTTIGNLYHYFPNKEALFEACVLPLMDQIDGLLSSHHGSLAPPEGTGLDMWIAGLFEQVDRQTVDRMRGILAKDESIPVLRQRERLEHLLLSHLLVDHGIRDDLLGRTLLSAFLSGMETVLSGTEDTKERARAMTGLVMLFIRGLPTDGAEGGEKNA